MYDKMKMKKYFALVLLFACSPLFAVDDNDELQLGNSSEDDRINLTALESELYRLESEYDAFHPALGEIAYDIANQQAKRGLFEDALVSYRRYLHIIRINEGLDTEKQIPVLEDIIETNYKAGKHEDAGKVLNRLASIIPKFSQKSLEAIPDLMEQGDFHLNSLQYSPVENQNTHLKIAYYAYKRIARIKYLENKDYDADLYKTLSAITYKTAFLSRQGSGREALSSQQGAQSYSIGKNDLVDAFDYAKNFSNPSFTIQALLQLGDWEHRFKKRSQAREYYLLAYNKAKELPDGHELKQIFDAHELIPALDFIDDSSEADSIAFEPVKISSRVSKWGTASKTVVLEDIDDLDKDRNDKLRRLAVRSGNSQRFRPKIINGDFVPDEDVERTIVLAVRKAGE